MFLLPYGNVENQEIPISISGYAVGERSLTISNSNLTIAATQNVELENLNLYDLIESECDPRLNQDDLDNPENGFEQVSDPWFTIIKSSDFQLPAGLLIDDGNNITGKPTEAGDFETKISIQHTYTVGNIITKLATPINIKFEIAEQENISEYDGLFVEALDTTGTDLPTISINNFKFENQVEITRANSITDFKNGNIIDKNTYRKCVAVGRTKCRIRFKLFILKL